MSWSSTLGATLVADGVRFRVWAPTACRVEVLTYAPDGAIAGAHPLDPEPDGHHAGTVRDARAGTRYRYRLDGGDAFPDPASRAQPDGVHGPSAVVDPRAFAWTDHAWRGVRMPELVLYELHVGTFTPEGTFDAAIARLDHVLALGATAVEVMPIAAFPGDRNWGYDGVALWAPAAAYGGAEGFRRFVDAAHARGLGVILDVVYNHFGPDGNYLYAVTGGRFFTAEPRTPWGDAIAYAGPDGAAVRDFVVQNALHWAHEYHVDGLRLDATHAIHDRLPQHVLAEIADRLHALDVPRVLIAEDERNERALVTPRADGGYGLDGVWADDFHHQMRRLLAGDDEGYFASFAGTVHDVVATLRHGWFYEGQPQPNGTSRGTKADGLPPHAFVHCLQNHDQVGNRASGDRLHHAIPLAAWRAASAVLCLSPYTPLLWMGQEWAARTPFQYFTDHDEELGRLVTEGRREEFGAFSAFRDPAVRARIPDPQDQATFARSTLRWDEIADAPHAGVLAWYRALLALRRTHPALAGGDDVRARFAVGALGDPVRGDALLALRRDGTDGSAVLLLVRLADGAVRCPLTGDGAPALLHAPEGRAWTLALDGEWARFGGARDEADAPMTTVDVADVAGPGAVVLWTGPAERAMRG